MPNATSLGRQFVHVSERVDDSQNEKKRLEFDWNPEKVKFKKKSRHHHQMQTTPANFEFRYHMALVGSDWLAHGRYPVYSPRQAAQLRIHTRDQLFTRKCLCVCVCAPIGALPEKRVKNGDGPQPWTFDGYPILPSPLGKMDPVVKWWPIPLLLSDRFPPHRLGTPGSRPHLSRGSPSSRFGN